MKKVFALVALGLVAGAAFADVTVVPAYWQNNYTGNGLNTIMRNAGNPRSYQMIIDASELTAIPVGYQIQGFAYRIHQSYAPWPPAPGASWDDYEIRIGTPATSVATMSTTFAANLSGNEVLVQDGPYTVPTNHFPAGGPPGPFGALIPFQQAWTYPGGDIIIDIRHPGGLHASTTGYLEAIGTTQPGYGTSVRAISQSTFTPTVGAFASAYVAQIHFVPEPATFGLLLVGLLLRRR